MSTFLNKGIDIRQYKTYCKKDFNFGVDLTKTAIVILFWCLKYMDWNNNKICFSAHTRSEVREKLKMTSASITYAIKQLKEQNYLRGDGGSYMVNPNWFWKGFEYSKPKALDAWNKMEE